ncbi:MAG TPA: hypothetical protein VJ673_11545 [Aromatoleum sp.]|uniref:hypothetical protein n=1 Tax=Aromatoleum sp. TaxID=2307007 RepID=UPI002B49B8D9|nr:hypothetical protein [Aromatoleum sp.]HJV26316.1 hypothetical protein [Aromatoleum sp.]
MSRSLTTRIGVLEARTRSDDEAVDRDPTDYAALRRAFWERAAHPTPAPVQPASPSGVAGVLHWRREIAETAAMATSTPPPDEPGKTNYQALRIMAAQKAGGAAHHALRGAELEVLTEAGFDPLVLDQLKAEHTRYAGIPWQWGKGELPPKALAVVEAAAALHLSDATKSENCAE